MKILNLFFFITAIISCQYDSIENNEQLINDHYISFELHKNWEVIEIDTSNKNVRIYKFGRTPISESNSLLNLIIATDSDYKKFHNFQRSNTLNFYKNASLSEVSSIDYLNKKAEMSTYAMTNSSNYVGANFSLDCGNYVLGINYQFSEEEEELSLKEVVEMLETVKTK